MKGIGQGVLKILIMSSMKMCLEFGIHYENICQAHLRQHSSSHWPQYPVKRAGLVYHTEITVPFCTNNESMVQLPTQIANNGFIKTIPCHKPDVYHY